MAEEGPGPPFSATSGRRRHGACDIRSRPHRASHKGCTKKKKQYSINCEIPGCAADPATTRPQPSQVAHANKAPQCMRQACSARRLTMGFSVSLVHGPTPHPQPPRQASTCCAVPPVPGPPFSGLQCNPIMHRRTPRWCQLPVGLRRAVAAHPPQLRLANSSSSFSANPRRCTFQYETPTTKHPHPRTSDVE